MHVLANLERISELCREGGRSGLREIRFQLEGSGIAVEKTLEYVIQNFSSRRIVAGDRIQLLGIRQAVRDEPVPCHRSSGNVLIGYRRSAGVCGIRIFTSAGAAEQQTYEENSARKIPAKSRAGPALRFYWSGGFYFDVNGSV